MKVIGITGGIGCGKSEVLKYLKSEGAYIIEADKLAHDLMKNGASVYNRIINAFGSGIIGDDGELDRQALGKIVFGDVDKLKALNSIVHPAVKEYIINDIEEQRILGKIDYYVIEAALLIQDGYKTICDEIWYIYADRNTRIDRLIKGRGGDVAKYETVMDKQADDAFYRNNSDAVIDNSFDFDKTKNELKVLLNKI